jgi:hypothetical protein
MKSKILTLAILTFVILLTGCAYDNYDPPASFLTGKVVYNGNPVGVRSGGTQLELWQYGYQLRSKIAVDISQDGTYSAKLFDGNYKLVRLKGAPWLDQTDTIDVTVSGPTSVDVPVTPYYSIAGETFTLNGSAITSTCNVTKVGTLAITSLTLYIGVTSIVDANNNSQNTVLAASALTDLSTPKNISVTLNSTLAAMNYVYARLGVQTAGVGERLYSPVKKITLH